MKKFVIPALVVGFFAAASQAGIIGSKHDFSNMTWSKNQICLPCHTAHVDNARFAQGGYQGPLWNHTLTTKTTGIIYNMWHSSGPTAGTTDLDPGSILCMSCHDGTVALDSFGGGTGTATMSGGVISRSAGTDLTGNHPVGSESAYPVDIATNKSTSGRFGDPSGFPTRFSLKDMTVGTTAVKVVGCGTCHHVHNGGVAGPGMLRIAQTGNVTVPGSSGSGSIRPSAISVPGSGLCLTCHVK